MTYFLEKETKEKEKVLEKSSFDHFFFVNLHTSSSITISLWKKINFKILIFLPYHCVKYAEMQDFFDTFFLAYGQNRIRVSPYKDRVVVRKIRIGRSRYFGIFYAVDI